MAAIIDITIGEGLKKVRTLSSLHATGMLRYTNNKLGEEVTFNKKNKPK